MDYGIGMQKARKALNKLWQKMQCDGFVGRLFGRKNEGNNPFHGSHITMSDGNELVSIYQRPNGRLVVLEFLIAENTSFGTEVREILEKEGLPVEK